MIEEESSSTAAGAAPDDLLRAAQLEEVRATLAGVQGAAYWRKLEELAARPAFLDLLRREFPSQAERFGAGLERRDFLRLMGASLGLAGFTACTRQPDERIVPFASTSEYTV